LPVKSVLSIGGAVVLVGLATLAALDENFLRAAWLAAVGILLVVGGMWPDWWRRVNYHEGRQVQVMWAGTLLFGVVGMLSLVGLIEPATGGHTATVLLLLAAAGGVWVTWGTAGFYSETIDRLGRRRDASP
jgi:hypothetical protein